MMPIGHASEGQPVTLQAPAAKRGYKVPRCCGQEMNVLLRRALVHRDGTVHFQEAWECRTCGRRIL